VSTTTNAAAARVGGSSSGVVGETDRCGAETAAPCRHYGDSRDYDRPPALLGDRCASTNASSSLARVRPAGRVRLLAPEAPAYEATAKVLLSLQNIALAYWRAGPERIRAFGPSGADADRTRACARVIQRTLAATRRSDLGCRTVSPDLVRPPHGQLRHPRVQVTNTEAVGCRGTRDGVCAPVHSLPQRTRYGACPPGAGPAPAPESRSYGGAARPAAACTHRS